MNHYFVEFGMVIEVDAENEEEAEEKAREVAKIEDAYAYVREV